MRIPTSSSLEERGDVSGAWVEIRDAGGAPIFRRTGSWSRHQERSIAQRRPRPNLHGLARNRGRPSLYYTTYDGRTWGTQHNYFGTGSSGVPAVLATWS
jgi:hypothetical protein